jgi:hypothetical protein
MESEKNGVTRWMWIIISIVLLLIVAAMLGYLFYDSGLRTAEIALSIWLVIGVIALLVALSFTAISSSPLDWQTLLMPLAYPKGAFALRLL